MIRGKLNKCPFGLPVTDGCKIAGGVEEGSKRPVIFEMTPLELAEDKEEAKEIACPPRTNGDYDNTFKSATQFFTTWLSSLLLIFCRLLGLFLTPKSQKNRF